MQITAKKLVRASTTALLTAAPLFSCIATNSGIGQATQGCPEFQVGQTVDANVKVDARVRAFMQASAQLGGVATAVRPAVRAACEGIAKDLGAQDTWSALGDTDDALSNAKGTGCCDAARTRVDAVLTANVSAHFALAVTQGVCAPDFTAEASCEAGCTAQEKCDSGTVETRCDPAQLSVVCQGSCSAQAYCEGRVDVETNCEGHCEAECTGSCSTTCTDENGHETQNDPNCHGKCKDHCSGKCNGRCQIDVSEGVQCGDSVYCKAGCTSSYTSPRCETEFTPPKCTIDESCFESCRATAVANEKCDPPSVKLLADVTVSADVATLVTTVNKNLPRLFQVVQAQGPVAVAALQNVASTGQTVLNASGSLDGHSLACATTASKSLGDTSAALSTSVQAGGNVTNDCASHSN